MSEVNPGENGLERLTLSDIDEVLELTVDCEDP